MTLTANTAIVCDRNTPSAQTAASILRRDMAMVLSPTRQEGGSIIFRHCAGDPESYRVTVSEDAVTVFAGDDLGYLYGAIAISRSFLGVTDLWFWNDQRFVMRAQIDIPAGTCMQGAPFAVRYRGWFINDEVLIRHWRVNGDAEEPWRMAFEALLRLGGNLVIPGTDHFSIRNRALAASYGLIITHHHAEPLGAEMFARKYPGLEASYRLYPELFEGLWREAVEAQKDHPTIFNIGFRGQGDKPFWADDPYYDSPERRGELMSRLIRKQYDLVKAIAPDAECAATLYGETMELYRDGYLHLPENVIRIWADNGYGKMVSRRQGVHDPRVPSMPAGEDGGRHGIYYHVSFYDLQAAGHMTTLPNGPEFVKGELEQVLLHSGGEYWIVNCSNIKPHVYLLGLIAEMWKHGTVDTADFGLRYFETYYHGAPAGELLECQNLYWQCAPQFGPLEDQHGADQLPNHGVRTLITQYMQDRRRPSGAFFWACREDTLEKQLRWFGDLTGKAASDHGEYVRRCEEVLAMLSGDAAQLFEDSVLLQARLLFHCYCGADQAVAAMEHGLREEPLEAFYLAGQARGSFLSADRVMLERQHDKWEGFYENDCLTDVRFTAHILEGLMHLFRAMGDGWQFWQWQRRFCSSQEDQRVVLLTNLEHRMSNLEMYEKIKEQLSSK